MIKQYIKKSLLIGLMLVAGNSFADQISTTDGSLLKGQVLQIHNGVVQLKTSFAGTLEINLSEIQNIQTDSSINVRLSDGKTYSGRLEATNQGMSIGSQQSEAGVQALASAWETGDKDPIQQAEEAAIVSAQRKWAFEAAMGLNGKSGNSNKSDLNTTVKAVLEGPNDRLEMGFNHAFAQSEDATGEDYTTADEIAANVAYTNFFRKNLGWYVKEDLERDRFENLKLRSNTAAGLTWKTLQTGTQRLEFSAGVGNRYESYGFDNDGDGIDDRTGSENLPGMDFAFTHFWKFSEWGEMNNTLSYNPAFEDFGNYNIDHTTTIDIPLDQSDFWKLRFSLSNQYRSDVVEGTENLDTNYGISLLLKWK